LVIIWALYKFVGNIVILSKSLVEKPMQEDLVTEFKSSFSEKVIETLVAFANTKGGKVLVGIDNNGDPLKGFTIGSESIQTWLNEIKNKTQPSIIPDAEFISYKDSKIVELCIKEFPIKPVSFRGRYFKRVKNSNHQLNLNEISELHLKTFNTSWDSYVNPRYLIKMISLDGVKEFINKCNKDRETLIEDDPLTVLKKLNLIKEEGVTTACYLLFGSGYIFDATIELGRFSTPTSIKDGVTVRSDLFRQVDEVLGFIKKQINKEYIITGDPQREERWQYPLKALREIIINMIVHRDYMNCGDSSIKIYNERIEFFNFGKLPDEISIEQLISGNYISRVRNKMIASTFKEAQLIEKYGSGIKRIQEGFINYGLPEPTFEEFQGGFRVTVYSSSKQMPNTEFGEKFGEKFGGKFGEKLSDAQCKIIESMKVNNRVTLSELAKLINMSQRGVEKNVKILQNHGFICRIGFAKGGYWHVN